MTKKVIFFEGTDAAGDEGLWESDGTAAGTVEITGISGAASTGLKPDDFRTLGSSVLFVGTDSAGDTGLWTTQGTSGTTKEITGITGENAKGLAPTYMTVIGTKELFTGTDAAGDKGLWVTDGTAAGTTELTVSGADSKGLDAFDGTGNDQRFAVLNGVAYFAGRNAAGVIGLWRTDGTSAGTVNITGITGNPEPFIIRRFGKELIISGKIDGADDLFISDGTAAGTHELTGITGAQVDSKGGLDPRQFARFGNKMLFVGTDSAGMAGVWTTDGTAAGTTEIQAFAKTPTHIQALSKSLAVFVVPNAAGTGEDLYVSDGTKAGTHELTGIVGADTAGLIAEGGTQSFILYDGKLYFAGRDATGEISLWETDGTAAGTKEVTGITGAGAAGLNPSNFGHGSIPATSADLGAALIDAASGDFAGSTTSSTHASSTNTLAADSSQSSHHAAFLSTGHGHA